MDMKVYPISENILTLALSLEDLQGRGLTSCQLEREEAVALLREVCQSYGLNGRPEEVECFCLPESVILFARLESEMSLAVEFSSLGVLLDALCVLPWPLDGAICRTATGLYYIQAERESADRLLEFGRLAELTEGETVLSRRQSLDLQKAINWRGGAML